MKSLFYDRMDLICSLLFFDKTETDGKDQYSLGLPL